jgi:hypothetical protein
MQMDEHPQASDEKQLCVSCMAPNEPSAHFCAKCGAPLSSYASTGPFEHLFAEGAVYRQAAERPRSLIVVVGIWLIFGMMALGTGVVLIMSGGSGFLFTLASAGILAVSIMMIWKTTRNYLNRKPPENETAIP